jgi:phosphoadenosine phosphosulfate reductase
MDAITSLEHKLELTRERLVAALERSGPERCFAAWTGGKDSTTALHLWRELLAERAPGATVRALCIDTGFKFPEIRAFRERIAAEWGVNLRVVRPDVDPDSYPAARDMTACCMDLKIEPLKRALAEFGVETLITGVRADEHPDRADRQWLEKMDDPPHARMNPILHWTEMDVWAHAMDAGLPYCELYDRGYRSIGCVPCTVRPDDPAGPERAGRSAGKEKSLGLLHGLGYF